MKELVAVDYGVVEQRIIAQMADRVRYRAEAFDEAAKVFEVYASDIEGAIRKGWYQAGEKKIQVARRDQLNACAKDMRDAAEAERKEASDERFD